MGLSHDIIHGTLSRGLRQVPSCLDDVPQMMYHQQLDSRRMLSETFAGVNDMYECLAVYQQKVRCVLEEGLVEVSSFMQGLLLNGTELLSPRAGAYSGPGQAR